MKLWLLTLVVMMITHWVDGKLAIITGGSEGIGHQTALRICKSFDGVVLITSKSAEKGEKAAEELKRRGCPNATYHQLEITSDKSVKTFRDVIQRFGTGIDILVNNAGVAFTVNDKMSLWEKAKNEMEVNYFGTKRVLKYLVSLLNSWARVVVVSSGIVGPPDLSNRLKKEFALSGHSMTFKELDILMMEYLNATLDGSYLEKGWNNISYGITKIGVTALTRIWAQILEASGDIIINSNTPCTAFTNMTRLIIHLWRLPVCTIEQSAMSSVYLALLPSDSKVNGGYFNYDCSQIDWITDEKISSGTCSVKI